MQTTHQLAGSSPCNTTLLTDKLAVDTALAVGSTAAEFDAFIKAEQTRWKLVIARAQIRSEGA